LALKNIAPPVSKRRLPSKKRAKKSNDDALTRAKKKKSGLKKSLAAADKKIAALTETESVIADASYVITDTVETPTVKEHIEQAEIIFQPNPGPQTDFLSAIEQEVLYGGAAGGGKSFAMLADPLRYAANPNHRAILFRHTNDELRELIWNAKEMYPKAYPKAKWSEQKSTWTFPSGATQWMTYLDRDDDVLRYQGQAYNWIGFDELTQWPTPFAWNYMRSRLRTTDPTLPLYMRGTTNPGNIGASWVRAMFIDAEPNWGQPFPARDLDTDRVLAYPQGHRLAGQILFMRRFIPARLTDNPYLYESGQYEANLLSLPEAQRRQLLDGDWDVVEGAAFPEFRRSIHVCDPFEIPSGWQRFRSCDWGYSAPYCVLWFAVDWDGNLYVYREIYGKGLDADVLANKILDIEEGESIRYGILDSSTWAKKGDTGPSIAEIMIKQGCRWRPSDRRPGSRVLSKMELHRRLSVRPCGRYDEEGKELMQPSVKFFSTCHNLIRTFPVLPTDKNNSEDVDTRAEDHPYDALRYGCSSRPINPSRGDFMDRMVRNQRQENQIADKVFGY